MLLWVNGPFGVGKTQTAHELHRRLPGSVVCDPEQVGFGLLRTVPRPLRGDFQDLAAWRAGVVEVLDLVLRRHTGVVVAPMTLVEPAYAVQVLGGLRGRGHDVRHVALLADRATVLRRLDRRDLGRRVLAALGGPPADTFARRRLDDCLVRLTALPTDEQLWTDGLTVEQVAEAVAARHGLPLGQRGSHLAGPARRLLTSARHVRFV